MFLETLNEKRYFGRVNELRTLERLALEAGEGEASGLLLTGRGSMGKTELLKRLYNKLFQDQDKVIPFYYRVNSSFLTLREFSDDYIEKFLRQCLAFIRKDRTMLSAGVYDLEELMDIAGDSGAGWAVDSINSYMQIRAANYPLRIFSFVISLPLRCYADSGFPVVAVIDDFHRTMELCKTEAGDSKDLWKHFDDLLNSPYTPHVLSGSQAELENMFFEETSIGDNLELLNLSGLKRDESIKLFKTLCRSYGINVEPEMYKFIDLFQGNPFYIKNFTQALRQSGSSFSGSDLLEIYLREITDGKLYSYWTSRLRRHVSKFSIRRSSLDFLNHLSGEGEGNDFSGISERLSIASDELDNIINLLNRSGTVTTGFSMMEVTDDRVLVDIIKTLYHREILKEPIDKIKETLLAEKGEEVKGLEKPAFEITILSEPQSELVAVKALQQMAQQYKIPVEITGQVQIALVELFTSIMTADVSFADSYDIQFSYGDNVLTVNVLSDQEGYSMEEYDRDYLMNYLDDLKVERTLKGTKIVMIKKVPEN